MTRLLCIEDDQDVAELVQEIFPECNVDHASNAETGLALLWDRHYEAVIVDLNMPGIAGDGFYRAVEVCLPNLLPRVLFITADDSDSARRRLRRSHCRVIAKPFVPDDLRGAVAAVAATASDR